jgi:hypothetical protein
MTEGDGESFEALPCSITHAAVARVESGAMASARDTASLGSRDESAARAALADEATRASSEIARLSARARSSSSPNAPSASMAADTTSGAGCDSASRKRARCSGVVSWISSDASDTAIAAAEWVSVRASRSSGSAAA